MSSGKLESQPTPPSDGAGTKRKNPPSTATKNTMPSTKVKTPQESTAGLDARNKLTAKIDEFGIQLLELSLTVVNLTTLGEMNTAEIKECKDKVQRLEEENQELKENVLELERHKRRWNLKLLGLTENDGECTRDVVVEILSTIAPRWAPSMETVVDAVRRLGRRDEGRIRRVVVWFTTRRHRDAFWKISKNSKVCKELGIRFKQDFCKADQRARAVVRPKMEAARAEGKRVHYRGHVGYIDGVRVEMAAKSQKDNMKALLQPDDHPFTAEENERMRKQCGGKRTCSQSSSSSLSSSSLLPNSSSNERAIMREKDLENQDMEMEHNGRRGFSEQSSSGCSAHSSMSHDPSSKPEIQEMETESGSGGGFNPVGTSSSLYPSSPNHNVKEMWGGKDQMMVPQYGSGNHFGHSHSSDFQKSSPSPQSMGFVSEGLGGKVSARPETKTMFGSQDGSGHSSSSDFQRSSPKPQSTWYESEGLGGKDPARPETKTLPYSGNHFGHSSSSDFQKSSPKPQSTWYESEGLGGKDPGRQDMKTQPGQREGLCYAGSYRTPPSSPSSQRSEREGRAAKNREQTDEEWKKEPSSRCADAELKRIHQCRDDLGPLRPNKKHTVIIDSETFNKERRIIPFAGLHVWHANFVKLPCVQTTSQGGFNQDSRWKQIKKQLNLLASKSSAGVREVEQTIVSFNPKYKGQWSFESLSKFTQSLPKEDNYISGLIPKIAALAMRLPEEVQTAIPLLRAGHVAAITMSQMQIACLLANAFFCTFPHRNTSRPNAEYHNYPTINFTSLFGNRLERKNEKLRAVMHYFKVVTDRTTNPRGLVTFERRLLREGDRPEWRSCPEKINKLHISSHGYIEREGSGLLQVDFANSLIGGGVLGCGLVQEEILFLISPELIVSRLFTERLQDDECLVITGSQQFSCYQGYSDSFVWLGPHEEKLQRDEWGRFQRQIVALDALHYRSGKEQFRMDKINRELNKAYCGFKGRSNHDNPDIATGKWGCGAFNGDPQLKAVIQLMAAAKAGRGLAFFTFENEQLERDLQRMHHLLVTRDITVGKLYGLLQDYCTKLHGAPVGLFEFLHRTITSEPSQRKHQTSYL